MLAQRRAVFATFARKSAINTCPGSAAGMEPHTGAWLPGGPLCSPASVLTSRIWRTRARTIVACYVTLREPRIPTRCLRALSTRLRASAARAVMGPDLCTWQQTSWGITTHSWRRAEEPQPSKPAAAVTGTPTTSTSKGGGQESRTADQGANRDHGKLTAEERGGTAHIRLGYTENRRNDESHCAHV